MAADDQGQQRVRRAFARAMGAEAQLVAVAPGRVNVIGEHTDYNDGFVLPLALPVVTRVAARARDDDRLRMVSLQDDGAPVELRIDDLEPGSVEGWAAYAAGAVWALREAGQQVRGADLVVDGEVPVGAGLSSSAALECSVALAMSRLSGAEIPPEQLARLAQRAENDFVGVPCGVMDQMASMLGRHGHALFLDTRTMQFRHVPFALEDNGCALLVVDTKAQHALSDGAYADRRRTCEDAAAALDVAALRDLDVADLDGAPVRALKPLVQRRVRHVVTENARVLEVVALLERNEEPSAIGPFLTASHASLRDDFEVSCDELDVVVDTALRHGAHGARMTGGGFGGSAIALVNRADVDEVATAVKRQFAGRGWTEPAHFVAVPSSGARVVQNA